MNQIREFEEAMIVRKAGRVGGTKAKWNETGELMICFCKNKYNENFFNDIICKTQRGCGATFNSWYCEICN